MQLFSNLRTLTTCAALASLAFASPTRADLVAQNFDDKTDWSFTATPEFNFSPSFYDVWGEKSVTGPIRMDAKFLAGRDIINQFNSYGYAQLDFASVDISDYESVHVSFDYKVAGFNAGDGLFYTLVIDGAALDEVQFVHGANALTETDSVLLPIPDGSSSVALQVKVVQDGGDGHMGMDNFSVSGTLAAIPEPSGALFGLLVTIGLSVGASVRRHRRTSCV